MTLWLFSTGQPWLAFSDIAIMRFLNCFTGPGSIWQTLQNILNLSKRFSLCGHSHHVWHIKQTHVLKCLEDHFMGSMWIEMDQPDSGNLGSDWCPLSSTVVHCQHHLAWLGPVPCDRPRRWQFRASVPGRWSPREVHWCPLPGCLGRNSEMDPMTLHEIVVWKHDGNVCRGRW
jgi:hypothetical protein